MADTDTEPTDWVELRITLYGVVWRLAILGTLGGSFLKMLDF